MIYFYFKLRPLDRKLMHLYAMIYGGNFVFEEDGGTQAQCYGIEVSAFYVRFHVPE